MSAAKHDLLDFISFDDRFRQSIASHELMSLRRTSSCLLVCMQSSCRFKPLLYQNIDIRSAWISPSMTFPPAPPRDVACENDDVRPLEIKSLKVAVQV